MAISFREFPWYIQALLFAALAVLLIAAGEFAPISPVAEARGNLEHMDKDYTALKQEVDMLQVYQRRYAEFHAKMESLQEQLDTLKKIVPEEKALDDFMRMLQTTASESGVSIRRLSAGNVSAKESHFEMPFEMQVDGPYFGVLDFFAKLGSLPRIINVGDLTFGGMDAGASKFPVHPGTSVSGTFTVVTYFTKPAALAAQATAPAGKK